ncbi:MAG: hypothetical protein HKN30_16050 [Sulfitobacter sp.]|nr:hypothetical protein [Sulfitobacter sp.]
MPRVLSLIALLLILALAFFWWEGGFDRLGHWAAEQQRAFQNTIARALRAARAGEGGAVAALLTACFAYGLAHAAGPGHGKVLIGGYGMARRVPMLRLSVIALAASLGQAVTAVALVYTGVLVLNLSRAALIGVTENIMAPASYAAIALIGLWLALRGLRKLRKPGQGHAHVGETAVCSSCGHAHGPTIEEIDRAKGLRDALLLIGSIGIRPCTGALFVLIITWQMGIGGLGIGGAFAMALGTALVTVLVGLAAGGLRGGLLAGIAQTPRLAQIAAGVEFLAGAAVLFLATGLLLRAL